MGNHRAGSIFAMLFGGVALVGVLGVSTMNLVVGPVSTAAKVTHQNHAQNDLLMNAKIVVMNASTRPNQGDEDGDGYVEPVPFIPTSASSCNITLPAGSSGGCLPGDIGAILTDPWGTQYMYCVWDHGDPASSTNRINGEDSTSGAVLAIISAGPNKRFETPCRAYDGDPATNDDAVNPDGNGDDLIQIYTYAAAVAGSGGLWELKQNEPETAIINKKLEIGDMATGMGFAFDTATGQGEFPYVKTDFIASKTGGNTPVTMVNNIALDGNWLSGDGSNNGIFVGADGRVGIGTSNPTPGVSGSIGSGFLHVVGNSASLTLTRYPTGAQAPDIFLQKARGTEASPSAVQPRDPLGYISWGGYNGTDFSVRPAAIYARVDDVDASAITPTNIPSSLNFAVTPSGGLPGSGYLTNTRMTISSDGNVGIGTTSPISTLHVEGGAFINSNSNTTPLVIGRTSMATANGSESQIGALLNQHLRIGIEDSQAVFHYKNDEHVSILRFRVESTDTEVGGGVRASNRDVLMIRSEDTGQRVGMGTSSPLGDFHVHNPTAQALGYISTGQSLNALLGFYSNVESANPTRGGSIGYDYSRDAIKIAHGTVFNNNNDGIILNSSNNVGIGVANPTQKLQVAGAIDVINNRILRVATPSATTDAANKAYVDTLGGRTSCTNGQLLKWNGTTWACSGDNIGMGDNLGGGGATVGTLYSMRADGYGFVGQDGNNLFRFDAGAGFDRILTRVAGAWTLQTEPTVFRPYSNIGVDLGSSAVKWKDGYFGGTVHSNVIVSDNNSATYDVWIQGNASTASPARKLALLGHSTQDRLYLNYNSEYAGGTTIGGPVYLGTQADAGTQAVRADRTIATGTGLTGGGNLTANRSLAFDTTWGDNRYLGRAGTNGVGTNDPRAPFHVRGSASPYFSDTNKYGDYPPAGESNTFAAIIEGPGTDSGGLLIISNDDNNDEKALDIWNNSLGERVFMVKSLGNIWARSHGEFGGNLTATNNIVAGNRVTADSFLSVGTYDRTTSNAANLYVHTNGLFYRSTSSERYKKDIRDYQNGLEKLSRLRPVLYKPNNPEDTERDKQRDYGGFIAEEVDAAGLSEFVEYDEQGRPDALHYGHMTSLLVKALQELKAENDDLRSRINAMEEKTNKP